MGQNNATLRRPRGRPQIRSDTETVQLIIEAAAEEFQANGYAATTMGAVAQRAGCSTKTMYRLIPTKADLFNHVIAERIRLFMGEINPGALDGYGLEQAVEHMLVAFGTLTLSKETVAMVRLVIGESDRFPEIAATFHHVAIEQTSQAMADWLEAQCRRGLLKLDDPLAAATALRGMMIMDTQRAVMLGQRPAPDAEEIAERASFCAKLFLDGCKAKHAAG